MRRWVKERLLFLDSLMGYQEDIKQSVTIRANKLGSVYLDISTYSPQYVKVKWRNGEYQTKKIGRNETVRFSSTLPTATDQEVLIYNAKHLRSIGDISNLSPSAIMIGEAIKLTSLVCHTDKLLSLTIDNNPLLQELNVSGCPNLGKGASVTSLNISKCTGLRVVNISNTNLTSLITDPNGGNLEEIYYPLTIQEVILKNQTNLTSIMIPWTGYDTHSTNGDFIASSAKELYIENCPIISKFCANQETRITTERDMLLGVANATDVSIINSGINIETLNFRFASYLTNLTLTGMTKLKNLYFSENSIYSIGTGGRLSNVNITNCPIEEIATKNYVPNYKYQTFNFAPNTILDFSGITTLKRIIASDSDLGKVIKLILPNTIEVFNFAHLSPYMKDVWINNTHISDGYTGLDLTGASSIYEFNIAGLVGINNITSLNVKSKTLLPNFNTYRDGSQYPWIQPEGTVDLSEYTGISIDYLFKNLDLNKISIIMPNNLNAIKSAKYTFANTAVSNSHVANLSSYISLSDCTGMFSGCNGITSVDTLPNTITNCNSMFSDCTSLTSFATIPDSVTDCASMFNGCENLISAPKIGAKVANCSSMFYGCLNLTASPEIPISVRNCSSMFYDCAKLSTMPIIPEGVTDITYMFNNCIGITTPTGLPSTIKYLSYLFVNCANLTTSPAIPIGVLDCQGMLQGCSKITQPPIIPSTVTNASYMFYGCQGITASPILPNSLVYTNNMFYDTQIVTMPDLPDSIIEASYMFYNCRKLTTLGKMSVNLTDCNGMFMGCVELLTAPTMPDKVKYANGTFQNCIKLTTAKNITSNMTELTNHYYGCSSLTTIEKINTSNILTVPKNMFYGCSKLQNMTFEGTIDYELDLTFSILITATSLLSVINALADRYGQAISKVLLLGDDNLSKLTPEQITIATNKNWTVA